jgi:hypothetical protein
MTFVRFFLKIFESPNKTLHRNQKKFLDFFYITLKPKNDHVTVYSRNKAGQNSTVFFQKMLKITF